MTDTKVCATCGAVFGPTTRGRRGWEKRRYCGLTCSRSAHRQVGANRRRRCKKDLHDLVDGNLYRDGRGQRRCKACTDEADRLRAEKARGDRPKRARHPKPAATPAPVVRAVETLPSWRPVGFPAVPNTRRAS